MADLCLSGGADGADLAWGRAAATVGHQVIHWSFPGHRSGAPRQTLHLLSEADLRLADARLVQTNLTLQRRWPVASPHTANLLRRNWFQVAEAGACYAVSKLDTHGKVDGGTAWAVQMFIDRHGGGPCPAFLFCQRQGRWFGWQGIGAGWRPTHPPRPSGIYAGIGSRKLDLTGAAAISMVY